MNPQLDIIVPTYNRQNDVVRLIAEIEKQAFKNFKVIIIDDHSPKPVTLKNKPAFVDLIYLPQNRGQSFARNIGIESSQAEIIISMDDDAWFEDSDALDKVLQYFNKYEDLGCLMFNIRTPDTPYLSEIYKLNQNGQLIGSHITCGCAYKKSVLESFNGFNKFFHSYGEETDVSLNILKAGSSIRFAPDIKLYHNFVAGVRPDSWYFRSRFNNTRNDLIIVLLHYPFLYIIPYFFGKLFSHVRYSIKNRRRILKTVFYNIWASFNCFKFLPFIIKNRKALKFNEFHTWIKMRW